MFIKICSDSTSLGKAAALEAAAAIRHAIANRGAARIIAANGASKFEFMEDLYSDLSDSTSLGKATALEAAAAIRHAIANRGAARIIAATGASQFEFLEDLTAAHTVDWEKVEMLDR